jgi:hypothetical protein
MQFLVVIPRTENASPSSLRKEDVDAEAELVRQLYAEGLIRHVWLRAEGGAAMIAEAESNERVAQALSALPLVRSGYLAQPQVSQLRPYSGFRPRAR